MTEPFVMEGDLWLLSQEGGFAQDAWVLNVSEAVVPGEIILAICDPGPNLLHLDDEVAGHFGAGRSRYIGNRHIGQVRITIEQIEEPENDGQG